MSNDIVRLQRALNKAGFGPLEEDGKRGPKTQAALERYQQEAARYPTGIDVSKWQPKVNWQEVKAAGASFAFCKGTHGQTFKNRTIDPEIEIAQAAHRIAKRHGFKLDYDWVRGSGRSAAKWYPKGEGKLG